MGEFDGVLGRLGEMQKTEKDELCAALRSRIIETVEENGGHLASNLGAVELTVGLYSVLDPFHDKIIWDVGHQCYAHKLLTGRDGSFGTLRSAGGISGFPSCSESDADCFETGHSSTSVSAAVGFARAKKLLNEDYTVCAIIGDGAFGSGMVFEALNDAGQMTDDIILILNDNGMSISPNVGALHKYLIRLRSGKRYIKAKGRVKRALGKMRGFGSFLSRHIERIKALMRSAVVPEGELFIDLGWKYLGPIDGHDVDAVSDAVRKAKMIRGPVIIHAITKKGKGYEPAENSPSSYHGISPKQSGSDECASFSKKLGNTLCVLGEKRPEIVAVCAAMVGGTGLSPFAKEFPDRYFDVGIAEEHAVTMAAAMSKTGLKPFICLYSTFSQRAYDQILHDVAQPKNGVVLCLDRGGVSGRDGRTHQGIYDLSFMNAMPGFTVSAPCDLTELGAFAGLAAESDCPFAIRYPAKVPRDYQLSELLWDDDAEKYANIVIGKGWLLPGYVSCPDASCAQKDCRVVFITLGVTVYEAIDASRILSEKGVGSIIFSARFLKPLDTEGIRALLEKYRDAQVVTLEDGIVTGGFGEEILRLASTSGLNSDRVHINGFPDVPVPHGSIRELYEKYGIDGKSVADRVIEMLSAGAINET